MSGLRGGMGKDSAAAKQRVSRSRGALHAYVVVRGGAALTVLRATGLPSAGTSCHDAAAMEAA